MDAAVFTCLTTCFYAIAWVGKFTISHLNAFNPERHVTAANLQKEANHNGVKVTVLYIPRAKVAPVEGEDVFWAHQEGLSDPYQALDNHLLINNPPPDQHLFTYHSKSGYRALTKHVFIKCLATAACAGGEEPL